MKILLCLLPPNAPDHPLLGVASLAGALRDNGHTVTLLDANIILYNRCPAEHWRWQSDGWFSWATPVDVWLQDIANLLIKTLQGSTFDGLALSCGSAGRYFIEKSVLAAQSVNPVLPIILGGPAFFHPDDISSLTRPNTDICQGEGEISIVAWANSLQHAPYEARQNKIFSNRFTHLDDLPTPDFTVFNQQYVRADVLPMETSRGCVNKCAFCDDAQMWKGYRSKSPVKIRQDLAYYAEHCTHITFTDSLLNPSQPQVLRLTQELTPFFRQHKITWEGMFECKGINDFVAEALAESGCTDVFLGVESFDEKFLRLLDKNITSANAQQAIRSLAKFGINVSIGFIIAGHPIQTKSQFDYDMEQLQSLMPHLHSVSVNLLCIPAGTPLWKKCNDVGIVWPKVNPWQLWHGGRGFEDVAQRIARCQKTQEMLRKNDVKTGNISSHKQQLLMIMENFE